MSPVTSTLPSASSVAGVGAASNATASVVVDKTMFMQLLVAQLKNQDPLNPSDSTQFVTQMAQFQQLEQSVNSGQDIAAIRGDADTLLAANASSTTQKT